MYYALQEKNYDVIKSIYEVKNSILTEFVSDELDVIVASSLKILITFSSDNVFLFLLK